MNVVPLFAKSHAPARFRYKCASCDQVHEGLPDITFEMPDVCHAMGSERRAERVLLTTDFCILEGKHYFIRCVMEAPVRGFGQRFGWGIWCRVDWKSFKLCWDRFEENDNSLLPLLRGTMANSLKHYPETEGLPCTIILQDNRMRPLVTLDKPDHPLAIHQHEGMDLDEAIAQAREIGALLIAS